MLAGYRGFRLATLLVFALSLGGVSVSAATYEEGLRAFDGKDYDLAYEIWKPLGEAGDALAQYSLGKLFEAGGGAIQQDFGEAQFWYGKAADQGVPAAQNNLALMHAQGRGVSRSVERAIELWYDAAKSDHPMAQYNLGLAYLRGEGLVKDEREAAAWFRRSADSGLPEAQYAVGQMNRLGLVLVKDPRLALAWYTKAADQGHKEAEVQVQILEANGVTVREIGPPSVVPQALKTPAAVAAANAEARAKARAEADARAKALAEEKRAEQAATESNAEAEGGDAAAAPQVAAAPAPVPEPVPLDPNAPAFTAAQSVGVADPAPRVPEPKSPEPEAVTEGEQTEAVPEVQAKPEAQDETPQIALAEAETPTAKDLSEPNTQEAAAPLPKEADPETSAASQAAAAPVTGGTPVKVWIASAKSEDEGMEFWRQTRAKYPELFSGTEGEIAKVDYGQGSTFFRLLAGPVASRAAATDLCKEFRAREPGAFCKVQNN